MSPEARARQRIDELLGAAGWHVCDYKTADLHAARGVAIREFELAAGHGTADYLLYVDGKAAGVVEAKKAGATLTGVETQSARYATGLPAALPAWRRPLPFAYKSTGLETRFTNGLDPEPRSRNVLAFHRPDTVAEWIRGLPGGLSRQGTVPKGSPVSDVSQPSYIDTFPCRIRQVLPSSRTGPTSSSGRRSSRRSETPKRAACTDPEAHRQSKTPLRRTRSSTR